MRDDTLSIEHKPISTNVFIATSKILLGLLLPIRCDCIFAIC